MILRYCTALAVAKGLAVVFIAKVCNNKSWAPSCD